MYVFPLSLLCPISCLQDTYLLLRQGQLRRPFFGDALKPASGLSARAFPR